MSLEKAVKLSELCAPLQDVVLPDTILLSPLASVDFPQRGSGNKHGLVSRRQAPPLPPVASRPEDSENMAGHSKVMFVWLFFEHQSTT